MNRLNHVKLVTPEPEVVDAFLREVCDLPAGWPLGDGFGPEPQTLPPGSRLGPGGELSPELVDQQRGPMSGGGFIAGNPESRQFQILRAARPSFWATCISTRDIESVHQRCHERGVPTTPISVNDFNERDDIRFFFCLVGGLIFEVIRVEPKVAPS